MKRLNNIFNIPWEQLPVQYNGLKPGFPNTLPSSIKELIFSQLIDFYPEINQASAAFKQICKESIYRSVINSNTSDKPILSASPSQNLPNFQDFFICLQSSFFLSNINPTEIDYYCLQLLNPLKDNCKHISMNIQ